MPPAFNLSQDQTLQFDLEFTAQRIEVNFTCMKIQFSERLKSLGPRLIKHTSLRTQLALALAFQRPRLSAVDF
jgi:hypothetical protein